MKTLRAKLDEFSDGNEVEHYKFIEEIRGEYRHSIDRVQNQSISPTENCIMYALKLTGNSTYASIKDICKKVAANDFGNWLLKDEHLCQIELSTSKEYDYLVYLDDDNRFVHISVIVNKQRVRSKWGCHGKYEHNIYDVPTIYGNKTKAFKMITRERAVELFKQFESND